MKTRVISAIVMCAIIIPILIIGGLPFKILAVVLSAMSMYEVMKAREKKSKIPLFIRILSYILIGVFVFLGTSVYSANYELIYKILIVIFLLYFIPVVFVNDTDKFSVTDSLYVLGCTIFLGVAYNSFVLISNIDFKYLFYII